MSTGISSWSNPETIGAMYPFVGTEVLLVIAAAVFWIWWHVKQIRDENRELEEAAAYFRRVGLREVMERNRAPEARVLSTVDTDSAGSGGVNPVSAAPAASAPVDSKV